MTGWGITYYCTEVHNETRHFKSLSLSLTSYKETAWKLGRLLRMKRKTFGYLEFTKIRLVIDG